MADYIIINLFIQDLMGPYVRIRVHATLNGKDWGMTQSVSTQGHNFNFIDHYYLPFGQRQISSHSVKDWYYLPFGRR